MSNLTDIIGIDGSAILNPDDPLIFLPPEHALQIRVVRYVCAGTAGAFLWETLNNMVGNYQLVSHRRIRLPTIVCFVSIISTLAYIIGSSIFQTTSVSKCSMLKKALEVLYCIAVPSTSLLFFFRTRAVFDRDPWIVFFFAFMWLAVFGSCLTPITGVNASNIGPTNYCMNIEIKSYAITAALIPMINDTLIFIAITWRLWCNSTARRTLKDGVRVLIFGDYLPAFSKAMLQDGQSYYLSTVTFNLITVIFLYIDTIPPILRTLATVPNLALMNIMACRVFRKTILGSPRENDISTSVISREIRAIPSLITSPQKEDSSTPGNEIVRLEGPLQNTSISAGHGNNDCAVDDKDHDNASSMV